MTMIEFHGAVINLEKVTYGLVAKVDVNYSTKWRFKIYFSKEEYVNWTFNDEADARARLHEFYQEVQRHQYVIQEMVP